MSRFDLTNSETRRIVTDIGWYEGRHIDISERVERLREFGWDIFPAAENFLTSFADLGDESNILLDFSDCGEVYGKFEIFDAVENIRDFGAVKFYPIGIFNRWGGIFISDAEGVYKIVSGYLSLYSSEGHDNMIGLFLEMHRSCKLNQRNANDS